MINIAEHIALPNHLLDHNYFRPVYEDNPNDKFADEDEEVPEVSKTYRVIPGVRNGSKVYLDNLGFKYYKHKAIKNRIYLVCERQKNRGFEHCPCRASVSKEILDNRIIMHSSYQHNHGPLYTNIEVPFLRDAIGERAIDPENMFVSIRTVYNDAIEDYPDAANSYTYSQARRRWYRMRSSR